MILSDIVVTIHSITLSGLAASKEYRFRLSSTINGVNCLHTIIVQPENATQAYSFWTRKLRDSGGATNNPLVPNTKYKIEGVFTKSCWTVNSGRIEMWYVKDENCDGLPDAEELTPWEVRTDISDINQLQNTKLRVRISEIMACNWYWGSGAYYRAKVETGYSEQQCDIGKFWHDSKTLSIIYEPETGRWSGDDHVGDSSGYRHSTGAEDGNANNQYELDHEIRFDVVMNDLDNDGILYWDEIAIGRDPSRVGWVGYFVVNDNLYPLIKDSLNAYVNAVRMYTNLDDVRIFHGTWSPQQLRKIFKSLFAYGMTGAVIVGHCVPVYFGTKNAVGEVTSRYDLSGIWSGGSGTYGDPFTTHTGDIKPEIWVGQLRRAYSDKALVYIDRDWQTDKLGVIPPMCNVFRDLAIVNTEPAANAQDFLYRITTEKYKFVQLMVHGTPPPYVFYDPNEVWVTSEEIHVRNLFSCSNNRIWSRCDGLSIGTSWLVWWREYGVWHPWCKRMIYVGDPALIC